MFEVRGEASHFFAWEKAVRTLVSGRVVVVVSCGAACCLTFWTGAIGVCMRSGACGSGCCARVAPDWAL